MSKPRINKQKAKEIILSSIEEGLTFTDTLGVIRSNSVIAESTFTLYWKECSKKYLERQKRLEKKKDEVRVEMEKEAVKYDILTRFERLEIATKIARNNPRRVPTKLDGSGTPIEFSLFYNSGAEVIRALDYLSKVEGDYAPEKQEVELKNIDPFAQMRRNHGIDEEAESSV